MSRIYENITEAIGNTPVVKLGRMSEGFHSEIYAKIESFNPLSSVKDRIGLAMIKAAEDSGKLLPGGTIIEPTSGNTGIALAFVAASRGYKLILTMPDTMSIERRKLLKIFGAELVLTEGSKGMKGAIEKADELNESLPDSIVLQQFENQANPEIHRTTTAREILEATGGDLDYFVSGVGTGGTLTGVGEILKKEISGIKIIAVEPEDSPVLSGGAPGPHKIQGIGAGFIPDVLNTEIIDDIIKVGSDPAGLTAQQLARKEGILAGISSGAALWAGLKIAEKEENKKILVILPDTGERYLSTWLFNN